MNPTLATWCPPPSRVMPGPVATSPAATSSAAGERRAETQAGRLDRIRRILGNEGPAPRPAVPERCLRCRLNASCAASNMGGCTPQYYATVQATDPGSAPPAIPMPPAMSAESSLRPLPSALRELPADASALQAVPSADYLSLAEAARVFGCTAKTLERWLVAGKVSGLKFGNRWRVQPAAIAAGLARA